MRGLLTSIFKQSANVTDINEAAKLVEQQGGIIKQRYNADIMRGFAAHMPAALADKFVDDAPQESSSMCVQYAYQCLRGA